MGFTTGQPWIAVNPNYHDINVRKAQADPNSILCFYRELLALRQRESALLRGTFRLLLPEHPQLLAYERVFDRDRVVVCCNFSSRPAVLPPEFTGSILLQSGIRDGHMDPYGFTVLADR